MKRKVFLLVLITLPFLADSQVTVQKAALMYLQNNATISVQGDFDAAENIHGEGVILLCGNKKQAIGLHRNSLQSLSIENMNDVVLSSPIKIEKQLVLQSGHFVLGRHNLELGSEAEAVGNEASYILTQDGGRVIKSVQRNLDGLIFPVGTSSGYSPLILRSSGTYNGAVVEIATSSKVNPNKPASSRDYLNDYWTINRKGITGDVVATAFYRRVTGQEENIQPFLWNGRKWIAKQMPVDTRNKLFSVDVPEGLGEIYAMRKGDELTPAASTMTLLPNPVHNTATLMIHSAKDEDVVLRIINNAGAAVVTQRVTLRKGINGVRINVMSLANGQYIISSTRNHSQAINMIKQ